MNFALFLNVVYFLEVGLAFLAVFHNFEGNFSEETGHHELPAEGNDQRGN